MKLMEIYIEDFKNLKNLHEKIDGYNVLLLGDNEVGKSSVIQFIKICLGDQECIPPGINGSGEMTVDLNGKPVKFELELKSGKPVIKVTGDGIHIDNKKGAIAQLVGAISFDPDKFVKLSETSAGRKEQIKLFKSLLDPQTQEILSKHEANVLNHYSERTELNRDIVKLEGSIKMNPMYNHVHELDKFKPVDVTATMSELKMAQEKNQKIIEVKQRIEQRDKDIEKSQKEVKELQAKIDAYNAEIDLNIEKNNQAKEWLKTNPLVDALKYDEIINSATEVNRRAQQAEALSKEMAKLKMTRDQVGEKTALIESERECITQAIREMEGPVKGLSFDDEQLIYNGVPVHPASLSTSAQAQLAVMLKRAENPSLPILLECSESWGQKKFDWLTEMSKNEDFQFIAERVESGKEKLELRIMKNEPVEA